MQDLRFPSSAVPAELPARIRLAAVMPTARPTEDDGWLHEVKHDGRRLVAILDGRGGPKLISRKGYSGKRMGRHVHNDPSIIEPIAANEPS
jgi:ATP-dependent DNA ligase